MSNVGKKNIVIFRYGQAYYNVHKSLFNDEVRDQLFWISASLKEQKFFLFLMTTTFKKYNSIKQAVFIQYFIDYRLKIPMDLLILMLLNTDRIILLPDILLYIIDLYDHEQGIIFFNITTPSELSKDNKKLIILFLETMTKRKILCNYAVDLSLIGGLRAQSKEFLYENSIRKKLKQIACLMD